MAHDKYYGFCENYCKVSIDENWYNENLVPNLSWFANSIKADDGFPVGIVRNASQYISADNCIRLAPTNSIDVVDAAGFAGLIGQIQYPFTVSICYGSDEIKSYTLLNNSGVIDSQKNIRIILEGVALNIKNVASSGNVDIYGIKIEQGSIPTTYVKSNEGLMVAEKMIDNAIAKALTPKVYSNVSVTAVASTFSPYGGMGTTGIGTFMVGTQSFRCHDVAQNGRIFRIPPSTFGWNKFNSVKIAATGLYTTGEPNDSKNVFTLDEDGYVSADVAIGNGWTMFQLTIPMSKKS